MGLMDGLGGAAKKMLFEAGLTKGDIFINKFDDIDHKKYFIVAGVSEDKIFTCSIYINSQIHPSLLNKPDLKVLQIPLMKKDYAFLDHDSFACCSTPLYIASERIFEWKEKGSCQVISKLSDQDLGFVTAAIVNSGLLSQEEMDLYFS